MERIFFVASYSGKKLSFEAHGKDEPAGSL